MMKCGAFIWGLVFIMAPLVVLADNIALSGTCSSYTYGDCPQSNCIYVSNATNCNSMETIVFRDKYAYRSCEGDCAPGYFKNVVTRSVIEVPGCEITFYYCDTCPSPGTSYGGTTSQTDCFIPRGSTASDASGSYKYAGDCHWKD